MNATDGIVRTILENYPAAQAIYLFGTYGTADEWPDSDVDIAVLLPPDKAKLARLMAIGDARAAIERLLGKDVDLINLRQVSTVFQKEIIMSERRIFCADAYAADEFEMLVLSFYQKLNEERADVLAEGLRSGRFYNV
jgi:predicted nucleotidyltransferase